MSTDPILTRLRQWIDDHHDEMVERLQEQLRIPSKEADPLPGAPFGAECRRALDTALTMAERDGFRTKNLEGYAGHAEFGEGAEMVMALGHLDVVPEGTGWTYPPYGAEIDGGYIYARGAGDDKGPTYASYFAARAVKEVGVPINRRIRVVFGCNEESGFRCVEHYFKHEEAPTYGFAPDAGWPLIYAEKGIANLTLMKDLSGREGLRVHSMQAGERPNIVPGNASAYIKGPAEDVDGAADLLSAYWDKNVTFSREGDALVLRAQGKAAHGAAPWEGDSAVTRMLRALREVVPGEKERWIDAAYEATHPSGVGLGIHGRDEVAGDLTSNLGECSLRDNRLTMLFNIRYPVLWSGSDLTEKNKAMRERHGFEIAAFTDSKPLHVPLDQEPVKTILAVAREEVDPKLEPGTMGGGTYARAVANTVAIGTGWPGDGPAHEANERYAITSYIRAAKIYAHILYRLATLP